MQHFQDELRERMQSYTENCGRTVDEIRMSSRIVYNPAQVNRFGDKFNIDFCTSDENNSDLDIIFFNSLVNEELVLRRLPIHGNLTNRRSRLLPYLMMEQRLALLQEAILRTREGREAALILIKQAIPCIMHKENRAGEKVINVVVALGAEKYQNERRIASLDGYVQEVQSIVQRKLLGTFIRPKHWKFPLKNEGKEVILNTDSSLNAFYLFFLNLRFLFFSQVGKVKLSNKSTRKFINGLHYLINFIFNKPEDEEKHDAWHRIIANYQPAMEILRKRSDYTPADIEQFQDYIDVFFSEYIKETGAEGITNYIHMLGSGHVKYYMEVHKNLYKYSQQGWESLNAKYKQVFFNHTQRGGHSGNSTLETD